MTSVRFPILSNLFSWIERETQIHKASHRMITVYALIDDMSVDIHMSPLDESALQEYKEIEHVETDVESDDYDILLESYMEITDDIREQASAIDVNLALEILGKHGIGYNNPLDGFCYFQFDLEGLSRSLSKRIPDELLSSYLYKFVYSFLFL